MKEDRNGQSYECDPSTGCSKDPLKSQDTDSSGSGSRKGVAQSSWLPNTLVSFGKRGERKSHTALRKDSVTPTFRVSEVA